jgi:iron complex outermembrane recepter protein
MCSPLCSSRLHRWWVAVVTALALTVSISAQPVTKRNFDLPAGDATKTLKLFADQSGEQIVYPVEEVRGIQTREVRGQLTAREALDAMLAKTGLVVVQDGTSGALAVKKADIPPVGNPGSRNSDTAEPDRPATAAAPVSRGARESDDVVELEAYVVTGVRASLESALTYKKERLEITDSIVASDINKLPDYNVTDALQRITGIQVLRDRGEGAQVTIRGLSQMENTLNGREVFTAGLGYTGGPSRTIDFADIPAEMVAGINVYKSASAEHIEGGIGGLIEMTTRRPFDFPGLQAVASVRVINGDLAETSKPQYSALVSNRWKLKGGGEVGALFNVIYQERAWREDQKGTGNPTSVNGFIINQAVTVQRSTSENTVFGRRERTGMTGVIQWRPSDTLELYAEANYTKFDTLQDTHQINASANGSNTYVAGSIELAPGTADVQKIRWTNPTISILAFARDTHDWTKQFAGGAIWKRDNLTVKADVSYTDSYNDLYFSGPFFAPTVTGGEFVQDLSTAVPSTSITGIDLTNPANMQYTGIAYRYRPFYGDLTAGSIDGTYRYKGGFFHTIMAGLRHGKRDATNRPGLIFADYSFPTASRPAATAWANLVERMPFGFLPYTDTPSIRNYMSGVLDAARDAVSYRALFGITTPLPAEASPLSLWSIEESTTAAYLMGKFKAGQLPLEGNMGVRYVRTQEALDGFRGTSATTAVPLNIDTTYNNILPSLNARYTLGDGTYLRFAASRSLTRPNFNQLSPSLTLVPNPINPELNQGSAGNPDLRPIKSKNIDIAFERYFNESTSIYATLFYKKVDGFIVSSSATETIDGAAYLITRPRNADPADIKGVEVGYSQFFDFLPEGLKGFGIQANYTFVDSETPNATLATNTQLQNLSRNSYNFIGMYETKGFSARIAYNFRDKFLSGQANIANVGRIPYYTKAYGWMDASLIWNMTDKFTLSLEGTNLLRTKRVSYFGTENRPQNVYINDRQFSVSFTVRM